MKDVKKEYIRSFISIAIEPHALEKIRGFQEELIKKVRKTANKVIIYCFPYYYLYHICFKTTEDKLECFISRFYSSSRTFKEYLLVKISI